MIEIQAEDTSRYTLLTVSGEMDQYSIGAIRAKFSRMSDGRAVIVDVSDVPFMDSAGMGALINMIRRSREADGAMVVLCSKPALSRLFETTGVTRIVPVAGTIEEAEDALNEVLSGTSSEGAEPPQEKKPFDKPNAEAMDVVNEASVADVITPLVIIDRLSDESTGVVATTVEALIGQVQAHLQEGSWSEENGFPIGLAQDIEGDLAGLQHQLRPLSGRDSNPVVIQSYVAQLADYLLDLAQRHAGLEAQERIRYLRSGVIDRVASLSGTVDDIRDATSALDALAFSVAWETVNTPDEFDPEKWDAFIEFAERHRVEVAADLVGWARLNRHEVVSGVFGSMTTAGGVGFFASSVAASLGSATSTTAIVGLSGSLVGAAIGAVLGILAVRFVTEDVV